MCSAANTPRGGSPTNDSPHSGSPTANGEKYQRLLTDGEAADAARNGLPMDDAFRYEDGMDVLKISGAATVSGRGRHPQPSKPTATRLTGSDGID
jgi:hypothetical protein